jgi:hypothetical protein
MQNLTYSMFLRNNKLFLNQFRSSTTLQDPVIAVPATHHILPLSKFPIRIPTVSQWK